MQSVCNNAVVLIKSLEVGPAATPFSHIDCRNHRLVIRQRDENLSLRFCYVCLKEGQLKPVGPGNRKGVHAGIERNSESVFISLCKNLLIYPL